MIYIQRQAIKSIATCIILLFFAIACTNKDDTSLQSRNLHNLTYEEAEKLPGYEVQFDYTGYPVERQKIFDFLKAYYTSEFHPFSEDQIGIDFYDIDDDGKLEALVYIENGSYCGSAGCSFHILKLDNNKYQYIWWNNKKSNNRVVTASPIKILDSKTLGYHDILFQGRLGYGLWQWQSSYYDWIRNIENINSVQH